MSAPRHSVRTRNAPEQGDNQESKPVEAQVKDAYTAPLSVEIDSTNINSDTESTRAQKTVTPRTLISKTIPGCCSASVSILSSWWDPSSQAAHLCFTTTTCSKKASSAAEAGTHGLFLTHSVAFHISSAAKMGQRPRCSGVKSTVPGLPWSIFPSLGVCCLLFRPLPQRAAESVYK